MGRSGAFGRATQAATSQVRPAPRTSNRRICRQGSLPPGLHGDDSMTDLSQADRAASAPSLIPADLSDDECVVRLARAIVAHDSAHLDEVARLIGRLAVTIE